MTSELAEEKIDIGRTADDSFKVPWEKGEQFWNSIYSYLFPFSLEPSRP
jgi:hypothetical protein